VHTGREKLSCGPAGVTSRVSSSSLDGGKKKEEKRGRGKEISHQQRWLKKKKGKNPRPTGGIATSTLALWKTIFFLKAEEERRERGREGTKNLTAMLREGKKRDPQLIQSGKKNWAPDYPLRGGKTTGNRWRGGLPRPGGKGS